MQLRDSAPWKFIAAVIFTGCAFVAGTFPFAMATCTSVLLLFVTVGISVQCVNVGMEIAFVF